MLIKLFKMGSEQQRKEGPSFAANEAKESSGFSKPVGLNGQLRKMSLKGCFIPFALFFYLQNREIIKKE